MNKQYNGLMHTGGHSPMPQKIVMPLKLEFDYNERFGDSVYSDNPFVHNAIPHPSKPLSSNSD